MTSKLGKETSICVIVTKTAAGTGVRRVQGNYVVKH